MNEIPISPDRQRFDELSDEVQERNSKLAMFESSYTEKYSERLREEINIFQKEKEKLLEKAWTEAHVENQEFDLVEKQKELKALWETISHKIPDGINVFDTNLKGITEIWINNIPNMQMIEIGIAYPIEVADENGVSKLDEDVAILDFSLNDSTIQWAKNSKPPQAILNLTNETDILSEIIDYTKDRYSNKYPEMNLSGDPKTTTRISDPGPKRKHEFYDYYDRRAIEVIEKLPTLITIIKQKTSHKESFIDIKTSEYSGRIFSVFEKGIILDSHNTRHPQAIRYMPFTKPLSKDDYQKISLDSPDAEQNLRKLLARHGIKKLDETNGIQSFLEIAKTKKHPNRTNKEGKLIADEEYAEKLYAVYLEILKIFDEAI
jgi:hypothetical protein